MPVHSVQFVPSFAQRQFNGEHRSYSLEPGVTEPSFSSPDEKAGPFSYSDNALAQAPTLGARDQHSPPGGQVLKAGDPYTSRPSGQKSSGDVRSNKKMCFPNRYRGIRDDQLSTWTCAIGIPLALVGLILIILGAVGSAKDTYTYTNPGITTTPYCSPYASYCRGPETSGGYSRNYGPSTEHVSMLAAGAVLLVCSIVTTITTSEIRSRRGYFGRSSV